MVKAIQYLVAGLWLPVIIIALFALGLYFPKIIFGTFLIFSFALAGIGVLWMVILESFRIAEKRKWFGLGRNKCTE